MRQEIRGLLLATLLGVSACDWVKREQPKPIPTPTVTPETVESYQIFDRLLEPFVKEAEKLRVERETQDPEYIKRIDRELNSGRVNFLLYGWGETHEPPLTEQAIIGSITIVSLDTKSRKVDLVSLTHDIRAPEIERYQKEQGQHDGSSIKIDQAYPLGGFALMRQALENATGFSVDFQIAFRDSVIVDFIDHVFGPLEVEVPQDFDVHPFYLDGKKFEGRHFEKGRQTMDGRTVIQFIKTVPATTGVYYDKQLEHNVRKHLIFEALNQKLRENVTNPAFLLRFLIFLMSEGKGERMDFDFDPKLATSNLWGTILSFGQSLIVGRDETLMPQINKKIYIGDVVTSHGGARWITGDTNPHTRRDLQRGVYKDRAVVVPYEGNPDGDLITEYWPSVRNRIKELILR